MMNRIVASAIFWSVVAAAHADAPAAMQPDLVPVETFRCESYVKTLVVLNARDDTSIQCIVLEDVHATRSSAVVIPKKSQLFGWKKGRAIDWTSWTTPDHVVVGDATLHGTAATSEIDPASEFFAVVVSHNISVPESERR